MKHSAAIQWLDLDGLHIASEQPLFVRIEARIRSAIIAGTLAAGTRLPASRALARDMKVSRHTAEVALVRLRAEGYLVRRRGSGTYVAPEVPRRESPPLARGHVAPVTPLPAVISRRGAVMTALAAQRVPNVGRAFTPSVPALELFPRQTWTRLMHRALRRTGTHEWASGATGGELELRDAIAAHVAGTRGVSCSADQVIVTTSAHQALDLVSRVLLDDGDAVWVEDPGYPPAVALLRAAGAVVHHVPVDADGFDIALARTMATLARLAYVTPSHQYPSGGLMSLARREALLAWAERERGWVVEDDYDGDLRYHGRPLAALHALDRAERVIYVGTFSKMIFPALRIAFLIAPRALVDPFLAARQLMDGHAAGHAQLALAGFIRDGHLASHLRRTLSEYDQRREALLAALAPLSDEFEVGPADAGLHLTVYLRRRADEHRIAARCAERGVDLRPLSDFYGGVPRHGFVLGFGCARPAQIRVAVREIAEVLRAEPSGG